MLSTYLFETTEVERYEGHKRLVNFGLYWRSRYGNEVQSKEVTDAENIELLSLRK
jgi:hypothetical protein